MSWVQHKHTLSQEGNQDEDRSHVLLPFFPTHPFTYHASHHVGSYHHDQYIEGEKECPFGGSIDPQLHVAPLPTSINHVEKGRAMKKMMRIARKPRKSPQDQQQQSPGNCTSSGSSTCNSSNDIVIRVCTDCHTTKTPLWRSGPQGPRSVCNACGIRRRKARKAMAAKAEATCSTIDQSTSPIVVGSDPKVEGHDLHHHHYSNGNNTNIVPIKKRYIEYGSHADEDQSKETSSKDNTTIVSSPSIRSHNLKSFPQDEKDAAILLMSLSCGLICTL